MLWGDRHDHCEKNDVAQAFRPAVSAGPEGPHYISSDFSHPLQACQRPPGWPKACEKNDVAQAFRPAVLAGPEGSHYIRSDFHTLFRPANGRPAGLRPVKKTT